MSRNRRPCGKKKFHDERAALNALAHRKHSDNPDHRESRHYYCRDCKAFHLTSKGNDFIPDKKFRFRDKRKRWR